MDSPEVTTEKARLRAVVEKNDALKASLDRLERLRREKEEAIAAQREKDSLELSTQTGETQNTC